MPAVVRRIALLGAVFAQRLYYPIAPALQRPASLTVVADRGMPAPRASWVGPAPAPPATGPVSALAVAGVVFAAGAGYFAGRAQASRGGSAAMNQASGSEMNPEQYEWVDNRINPSWKDPREGKPFTDEGKARMARQVYQPRGINDGTLKKRTNLIESEDEPWHATSRPAQILDLPDFDQGLKNSIGFMEAEETLTIANSAAKNAEEVTKALEQAKKDGAREGSPALLAADKLLKAFQKADKTTADLNAKLEELKKAAEEAAKNPPPPEEEEEEMEAPVGVNDEDAPKEEKKEEKKKEEEVDPIKAVEDDIKKAMDAALKARPKAPKKPGAQGSGWDDQKRAAGATHSTAGFV